MGRDRKSLYMTAPGYMDEKWIKTEKNVKYLSPNPMSPSPLPGPPNSERISAASSNVLSPTNDNAESLSLDHDKEVLEMDEYNFKIVPKKKRIVTKDRVSISCKSFITLFDEKKEMEFDDDDDDDDVSEESRNDGIEEYEESKTEDLSKLLFGRYNSASVTNKRYYNKINGTDLFNR